MTMGDHHGIDVAKRLRAHPALGETDCARIEEQFVPLILEQQAGVEILGDLHACPRLLAVGCWPLAVGRLPSTTRLLDSSTPRLLD
jgi:hypothetical protein